MDYDVQGNEREHECRAGTYAGQDMACRSIAVRHMVGSMKQDAEEICEREANNRQTGCGTKDRVVSVSSNTDNSSSISP